MRIQKRTVLSTAERRQRLLLFLFGIILCGVAVHTLLLRRMPDASVCQVLFRYLLPTEQLDQARWVLAAARQGIFFLLGWFLLGFSAVGQPGAVFLLGGYGMSLGKILTAVEAGCICREFWFIIFRFPYGWFWRLGNRFAFPFTLHGTAFRMRRRNKCAIICGCILFAFWCCCYFSVCSLCCIVWGIPAFGG